MDWEKADRNLGEYLGTLVADYACKKKLMFGAAVYFVNDNMWTGVKGKIVFLRLSENDRLTIQTESDEIRPFEPAPGRFMKEYVEVPESKLADDAFARKWLDISYSYVKSLPPKVKKEKKAPSKSKKQN
ncbi:hypothetical protein E4665_08715 [Sporolactobacillus shoreae]|uniref:TfoX N-terminal domain-containing protein n=1 Tax=Sporolactobacillus shoreae TaxID=1465501 RepID=A0A4Z0GQE7_9BACL|nr:TfoX/Sxy family protein [Sporolactobacillus shoreae]TGA98317.1 hypothetical protein E4665_08715 [Sporolactobacillus shoreae]